MWHATGAEVGLGHTLRATHVQSFSLPAANMEEHSCSTLANVQLRMVDCVGASETVCGVFVGELVGEADCSSSSPGWSSTVVGDVVGETEGVVEGDVMGDVVGALEGEPVGACEGENVNGICFSITRRGVVVA